MANVNNLGIGAGVVMGVKKKKKKDLGIGAVVNAAFDSGAPNKLESTLGNIAMSYHIRTGRWPSPDKALPMLQAVIDGPFADKGVSAYKSVWEAFANVGDYDPLTGEQTQVDLPVDKDIVDPTKLPKTFTFDDITVDPEQRTDVERIAEDREDMEIRKGLKAKKRKPDYANPIQQTLSRPYSGVGVDPITGEIDRKDIGRLAIKAQIAAELAQKEKDRLETSGVGGSVDAEIVRGLTPLTTVSAVSTFVARYSGKTRTELQTEGKLSEIEDTAVELAKRVPGFTAHYDNNLDNVVYDNYFDHCVKQLVFGRAQAYAILPTKKTDVKDRAYRLIEWASNGKIPAEQLYDAYRTQFSIETRDEDLKLQLYRGYVRGRPSWQSARAAREEWVTTFGKEYLPEKALANYEEELESDASKYLGSFGNKIDEFVSYAPKFPKDVVEKVGDAIFFGNPVTEANEAAAGIIDDSGAAEAMREFYYSEENAPMRAVVGAFGTAKREIKEGVITGITDFAEAWEWWDEHADQFLVTVKEQLGNTFQSNENNWSLANDTDAWGPLFSAEMWAKEWKNAEHQDLVHSILYDDLGIDKDNGFWKAVGGIADFALETGRDVVVGRIAKSVALAGKAAGISGVRGYAAAQGLETPGWARTLSEAVASNVQKQPMALKVLFDIKSMDDDVRVLVEEMAKSTNVDEVSHLMHRLHTFGIDVDPGSNWLWRNRKLQRLTQELPPDDAYKTFGKLFSHDHVVSYTEVDHQILNLSRALNMGNSRARGSLAGGLGKQISERGMYWAEEARKAGKDINKIDDVWTKFWHEVDGNMLNAACPDDLARLAIKMKRPIPKNLAEAYEFFKNVADARAWTPKKLVEKESQIIVQRGRKMALPGYDESGKVIDLASRDVAKIRKDIQRRIKNVEQALDDAKKAKNGRAIDQAQEMLDDANLTLMRFNADPSGYRPFRSWQVSDGVRSPHDPRVLGQFLLGPRHRAWMLANIRTQLDRFVAMQRLLVTTNIGFPIRTSVCDEGTRLLVEADGRRALLHHRPAIVRDADSKLGFRIEDRGQTAKAVEEMKRTENFATHFRNQQQTWFDESEDVIEIKPGGYRYAKFKQGDLEGDAKEPLVREWLKQRDLLGGEDKATDAVRAMLHDQDSELSAALRLTLKRGHWRQETTDEAKRIADKQLEQVSRLESERTALESEIQQLKTATTLDPATDSIIKKYADEFRGYANIKATSREASFLKLIDDGAPIEDVAKKLRLILHMKSGVRNKDIIALKTKISGARVSDEELDKWVDLWADKLTNEYMQVPAFRKAIESGGKELPSASEIDALVSDPQYSKLLRMTHGATPRSQFGNVGGALLKPVVALNRGVTQPMMKAIGDRVKLQMGAGHYMTIKERLMRQHPNMGEERINQLAFDEAIQVADRKMYTPNFTIREDEMKNLIMFLPAYRQFVKYWGAKFANNPLLYTGLQQNMEDMTNKSVTIPLINLQFYLPAIPFWADSGEDINANVGSTTKFALSSMPGASWGLIFPMRIANYASKRMTGDYSFDDAFEMFPSLSWASSNRTMLGWFEDMYYGIFGDTIPIIMSEQDRRIRLRANILQKHISEGLRPDIDAAISEMAEKRGWNGLSDFLSGTAKLLSPVGKITFKDERESDFYEGAFALNAADGDTEEERKVLEKYTHFAKVEGFWRLHPKQRETFLLDPANEWAIPYLSGKYDMTEVTKRPLFSNERQAMIADGTIRLKDEKQMVKDIETLYDLVHWERNLRATEKKRAEEIAAGKKWGEAKCRALSTDKNGFHKSTYDMLMKAFEEPPIGINSEDRWGNQLRRVSAYFNKEDFRKYSPWYINRRYENSYKSVIYETFGQNNKTINNAMGYINGMAKQGGYGEVQVPMLVEYLNYVSKATQAKGTETTDAEKEENKDAVYNYQNMLTEVAKLVPEAERGWITTETANPEAIQKELDEITERRNANVVRVAGDERWNLDATDLRDLGFDVTQPKKVSAALIKLQNIYDDYSHSKKDKDATIARRKAEDRILAAPYMRPFRGGIAQRLLQTYLAKPNWAGVNYKPDASYLKKSASLMYKDWTAELNPIELVASQALRGINTKKMYDLDEAQRATAWAGVLAAAATGREILAGTPNPYYDDYPGVSVDSNASDATGVKKRLQRYVREWMALSPKFAKEWKWLEKEITFGGTLYDKLLDRGV